MGIPHRLVGCKREVVEIAGDIQGRLADHRRLDVELVATPQSGKGLEAVPGPCSPVEADTL